MFDLTEKRIGRAEEQIIQCVEQKENVSEPMGTRQEDRIWIMGEQAREQENWKEGLSTPHI